MMDSDIITTTLPAPDPDTGTFTSSVEFFIDKMRGYWNDRVWVMIESADDLRCNDHVNQIKLEIEPSAPQDFDKRKGILFVVVLRLFTENDTGWISYQSTMVPHLGSLHNCGSVAITDELRRSFLLSL